MVMGRRSASTSTGLDGDEEVQPVMSRVALLCSASTAFLWLSDVAASHTADAYNAMSCA